MTNEIIPEPGPARDRMVAEVVGWPHWDRAFPWNPATAQYFAPSTNDADALAALEAWRAHGTDRSVSIEFARDGTVWVELFDEAAHYRANEPTFPAAATAALLATREDT